MEMNELYILYGAEPKEMVKKILEKIRLEEEPNPGQYIGIKPNLVLASKSEEGATTDPELVAGIIEYLQEKGCRKIVILEGSWIGDRTSRAFEVCGYNELARKYGVDLIDLQQDPALGFRVGDLEIKVCQEALAVDYLINVPVLKGHCQTRITCALKNMKGCIPDTEKRRFHTLGLHRPIAYLNKVLRQDLIIVDGIYGDLDFEEGGNPVQMNRVIVARDPVLVDTYVAELLGYEVDEIPYIRMAAELRIGSTNLDQARIIELNQPQGERVKKTSAKVSRLTRNVVEDQACSACFGNLVHALKRLDEEGELGRLKERIYIGQGFKGKEFEGIGIGSCTRGATKSIAGCPPVAMEILKELRA
ncbi:MAG TPA: DUF362 domain-containing protein [Halanaerobiales bacterium]|nr:DUF362 domain-containing protein [Halanaerobiales bacterium]HPZ63589.1 DUF362 domain-containing protein [Halanaerobiales bacterium]